MLVKVASRKEFLDVLQAQGLFEVGDLRTAETIENRHIRADEVLLLWSETHSRYRKRDRSSRVATLPQVIVVNLESRRDFLAWISTYLPELKPLTAYTRVLSIDEFHPIAESKSMPGLDFLEEASIGLVLAEAATYLENKQEKKLNFSPLACAGTFSFAMARSFAISCGMGSEIDDEIVMDRWIKVRTLTKQQSLKLRPDDLAIPWRVLGAIYSAESGFRFSKRDLPDVIYSSCLSILEGSELDPSVWDRLALEFPRLREAKREMAGPREGRVVFFEQFLLSLSESRLPDSVFGSFLCGFLASQIGPGTLDYLMLLIPYLDQFPSSLLWYGLCSGLQRRASLYGFSSGVGRRVLREIIRADSVFSSPQADIAIAELEVMSAGGNQAMDFRTGAQGILTVEILPMILTTVRWPAKQFDQPELFPNESSASEFRELSLLVEDVRQRLSVIQSRISRSADESSWKANRKPKR